MSRLYFQNRRAYWPRLLPMVFVSVVVVAPVVALVASPWVGALWGAVVGIVVPSVRIWVWRRRHPRISPEEWLEDRRRAAPWN